MTDLAFRVRQNHGKFGVGCKGCGLQRLTVRATGNPQEAQRPQIQFMRTEGIVLLVGPLAGTPAQKKKYLGWLTSEPILCSYATTEAGAGRTEWTGIVRTR